MINKYHSMLEELSSLQVENQNILDQINYLYGDKDVFLKEYQSNLINNKKKNSIVTNISIMNFPLLFWGYVVISKSIEIAESTSFEFSLQNIDELSLTNLFPMIIYCGVDFFVCIKLLKEYFSENKMKKQILERNSYPDVIRKLNDQLSELHTIYSNNLIKIDIYDSIIAEEESIQKKIGPIQ